MTWSLAAGGATSLTKAMAATQATATNQAAINSDGYGGMAIPSGMKPSEMNYFAPP